MRRSTSYLLAAEMLRSIGGSDSKSRRRLLMEGQDGVGSEGKAEEEKEKL